MVWLTVAAIVCVVALATLAILAAARLLPPSARSISTTADEQAIFVLGDSFAQSPHFQNQFPAQFAQGRRVEIDGVGASSLAAQHQRFLEQIANWKSILVILDGGLTDSSAVRPVGDIIASLDPGCGRWLYVEPPHSVADGPTGAPAYRRQTELVAEVRQRWPDHFVPLIDALRGGADGSAQDRVDVAAGWTPASLRERGDPIHLNANGNAILSKTIAQAIVRLDAMPSAACSGPTRWKLHRPKISSFPAGQGSDVVPDVTLSVFGAVASTEYR